MAHKTGRDDHNRVPGMLPRRAAVDDLLEKA